MAYDEVTAQLVRENRELREALHGAATSLETISMLSGRVSYGNPPIPTYMEDFSQVRGFAANRAKVAREALAAAGVSGTRDQTFDKAHVDGGKQ
jgi:hypothetical protein